MVLAVPWWLACTPPTDFQVPPAPGSLGQEDLWATGRATSEAVWVWADADGSWRDCEGSQALPAGAGETEEEGRHLLKLFQLRNPKHENVMFRHLIRLPNNSSIQSMLHCNAVHWTPHSCPSLDVTDVVIRKHWWAYLHSQHTCTHNKHHCSCQCMPSGLMI